MNTYTKKLTPEEIYARDYAKLEPVELITEDRPPVKMVRSYQDSVSTKLKCSKTKMHKRIINDVAGFECECCGTMMCENCPAPRPKSRTDPIICEECSEKTAEERSKIVKPKRKPYVFPEYTEKEKKSIKAIAEAINNC